MLLKTWFKKWYKSGGKPKNQGKHGKKTAAFG